MSKNTTDWQARLDLSYAPSTYQAGIFEFVAVGDGHGVVEAVAGSGKTTTIVSAARLLTDPGLFLAFNKVIAEMLGARLRGTPMAASTIHSHGFSAVRNAFAYRVKVDAKKYRGFVDNLRAEILDRGTLRGDDCTTDELRAIDDDGFPGSAISKLIDLARLSLVAPGEDFAADVLALADHHRIDFDPSLGDLVTDIVRLALEWGADFTRVIDYTDMVWLPTVLGLQVATYAWVFVDECQDISAAHLELIMRSIKPGGRALFVGDPRQAIYGFAGADAASFGNIIERTKATILPLSVCYRCPTSVIELAQEITPQIQARPGAPAGIVRDSTAEDFIDGAREGDMVLCRINAPLLSLAFKLIASGVPAAVRGRDIGKGLGKVVTECSKRSAFSDFGNALDQWEEREIESARKRFTDEDALAMRIEAINDQAECVRIIHAHSGATSATELRAAIDELFADDRPAVVLSSVHRAKGLEAERVFIARPERLGVARAGAKPWMIEQETNLEYVAYTRALSELVFLVDTAAKTEPDEKPMTRVDHGGQHAMERSVMKQARDLAGPAALPPVDVNAPDTYDATSPDARVALARRLDASLRAAGFAPVVRRGTIEFVYEKQVAGSTIRIYSTIVGREVRGLGKDAIRVTLIGADGKPIGKTRRVNRVGLIAAILDRVHGRVTAMTARNRVKSLQVLPIQNDEIST